MTPSEAVVRRCSLKKVFSFLFCQISKKAFFYRTPPVAASAPYEEFLRAAIFQNMYELKAGSFGIYAVLNYFWYPIFIQKDTSHEYPKAQNHRQILYINQHQKPFSLDIFPSPF